MDRLLIVSLTRAEAMAMATEVGLNSSQYSIITKLSELTPEMQNGIYSLTNTMPADIMEIQSELRVRDFNQLPNMGYPIKDYFTKIIDEVGRIQDKYQLHVYIQEALESTVKEIKKMFDSCKMTKEYGFEYEIVSNQKRQLSIRPLTDKMKVIKDLINAVGFIRY